MHSPIYCARKPCAHSAHCFTALTLREVRAVLAAEFARIVRALKKTEYARLGRG